jgi:hypothetical protein
MAAPNDTIQTNVGLTTSHLCTDFPMEHRREVFLIRWNIRWTVPYQMGFTSKNLITNTAAVVLLWIWVHLFCKRYVQKGPVNWLSLLQFNMHDSSFQFYMLCYVFLFCLHSSCVLCIQYYSCVLTFDSWLIPAVFFNVLIYSRQQDRNRLRCYVIETNNVDSFATLLSK